MQESKTESNPQRRSRSALSLVLMVFLVVVVGIWGISSAIGQDGPSENRFAPTPTPARLTGIPDIAVARNSIVAQTPSLARFIAAIETENVSAAVAQLQFQRTPCDQMASRGVTECSRRGLQSGTELDMFVPDGFSGYGIERQDVEASMEYFVAGRTPRLALAANRSDGSVILVFSIAAKEGLIFPGAIPEGGAPVVAVYFITVPGADGKVATYGYQSAATPPLEFLHADERAGIRYEILGVADEYRQRDLSSFATAEAQSGRN